ncbi:hypothetical protein IEQ34_015205 [Dendrobium chrysotoxum]|uniref:EF-hand domain-containing protein n=1 Tax=Dendrobium chrysotoxum TaxID=161865 RepID=A0AAV7GHH1_DENCH|nr:hypothetical protein IEQ34_015205 [Dendrobium chrysotoxum]
MQNDSTKSTAKPQDCKENPMPAKKSLLLIHSQWPNITVLTAKKSKIIAPSNRLDNQIKNHHPDSYYTSKNDHKSQCPHSVKSLAVSFLESELRDKNLESFGKEKGEARELEKRSWRAMGRRKESLCVREECEGFSQGFSKKASTLFPPSVLLGFLGGSGKKNVSPKTVEIFYLHGRVKKDCYVLCLHHEGEKEVKVLCCTSLQKQHDSLRVEYSALDKEHMPLLNEYDALNKKDRDGKLTPEEVAAATMYLKDTLNKEDMQELITNLSKNTECSCLQKQGQNFMETIRNEVNRAVICLTFYYRSFALLRVGVGSASRRKPIAVGYMRRNLYTNDELKMNDLGEGKKITK